MSSIFKEGLLLANRSLQLQFVRYRRVNVQRPRAPHYERALALALLKPQYQWERQPEPLPLSETCKRVEEIERYTTRPDNPLEKIIAKELREMFETKKMLGFLHANPISGSELFDARVKLKKEGMTLEVYSKHIVAMAVQGTPYEAVLKLFVSHNAMVFCDEVKVGKMIKTIKKLPQYVLMAGLVDGRLLSLTQLQNYAQLGTLTAARAQLAATLNSVGSTLVSRLNETQNVLVTQLNQIAEQKGKTDN